MTTPKLLSEAELAKLRKLSVDGLIPDQGWKLLSHIAAQAAEIERLKRGLDYLCIDDQKPSRTGKQILSFLRSISRGDDIVPGPCLPHSNTEGR